MQERWFPALGEQVGWALSSLLVSAPQLPSKALAPETEDEDEEDDSEDAISEFDFLGSGEDGEGPPDPRRCATEGAHHELGELGRLRRPSSPRAPPLPAACSCFLPQGPHRPDALPERRVAPQSQQLHHGGQALSLSLENLRGSQAGPALPEAGPPALPPPQGWGGEGGQDADPARGRQGGSASCPVTLSSEAPGVT